MPTTYRECDEDIKDQADAIMRRFHRELCESGVTVKFLFHCNADGNPLKFKGWPAAATVKIHGLKDRVAGLTDCTITIDEEWWNTHDQKQCDALLDHEFEHLLVGTDDDGKWIVDDIGRPKLKMRPHDFEVGGFDAIVKRHGISATEARIVAEASSRWLQAGLDFSGNDMTPPTHKSICDKIDGNLQGAGVTGYERNAKV